jgi:hypothetical protein
MGEAWRRNKQQKKTDDFLFVYLSGLRNFGTE